MNPFPACLRPVLQLVLTRTAELIGRLEILRWRLRQALAEALGASLARLTEDLLHTLFAGVGPDPPGLHAAQEDVSDSAALPDWNAPEAEFLDEDAFLEDAGEHDRECQPAPAAPVAPTRSGPGVVDGIDPLPAAVADPPDPAVWPPYW